MAKAKKVTKRGQRRTGTRPGTATSGSGGRTKQRQAARRARASRTERGPAVRVTTVARRTRRTARTNVHSRATSAAKAAAGPTLPVRDLIRGGARRSPKAPHFPGAVGMAPQARRRTKTAHGLRAGSTLVQNPPGPREWLGVMKPGIPKR